MSVRLAVIRENIRYVLNDLDRSNEAVDPFTLDRTILAKAQEAAASIGNLYAILPSVISITAAVETPYILPNNVDIWQVNEVIYDFDRRPLQKIPLEELHREKAYSTTTSQRLADPTKWALFEEATDNPAQPINLLFIELNTIPNRNTSLTLYIQTIPNYDETQINDDMPIPFPQAFCRSLEKCVAAELLLRMPQDVRDGLRISTDIIGEWKAIYEQGMADERRRQRAIPRAPYGVDAVGSWWR